MPIIKDDFRCCVSGGESGTPGHKFGMAHDIFFGGENCDKLLDLI